MKDFETAKEEGAAPEELTESAAWSASELQTAAMLSYAVSDVPLPTRLKDRLFERIAGEVSDTPSALTSDLEERSELFSLLGQSLEMLKQQAESMQWTPMGTLEGFEMATLKVDQATNSIAFFVRAKTGGRFPLHRHAEREAVLVLDGDFVVDGQSYGGGDRVDSPAATSHAPETRTGCLLFCVSSVDDEMLN